jgi:hypothetical protein
MKLITIQKGSELLASGSPVQSITLLNRKKEAHSYSEGMWFAGIWIPVQSVIILNRKNEADDYSEGM